jgi:hypothetical protein
MASLAGYISDVELYYESDSTRNLLTGQDHTVSGSDNLIVGRDGTVDAVNLVALFSLDEAPHTISAPNTFAVYADNIILNGTTLGSGGIDISALLDGLGT